MSFAFTGGFPSRRPRRLRRDDFTRRMVREHRLAADDFIYPVFVLDGTQRQRLGVAAGHATTSLTIPDRLIRGGSASLRFFCDPIGGGGLPVSEEIVVEPGDTVELIIPST